MKEKIIQEWRLIKEENPGIKTSEIFKKIKRKHNIDYLEIMKAISIKVENNQFS